MSTNGVKMPEDSEMADCDGEKVVTMMDVLQEQQEFEEDANAVLGASDDKNCTYAKGYIKRQAVYACMTCCTDAKTDPAKRAGVCLACSLSCHENHELIELYTKRNFRCDCGNPKFNSNPCQFNPNKMDLNEDNKYNQNYSGVYCICHRPYPDPESTVEDEMIQCIICEDWLHASHLDAVVPAIDQYAEMICKDCMENNEFIHDYSNLAITAESVDVEVCDKTMSNGNTTNSEVNFNGDNESDIEGESNRKNEAKSMEDVEAKNDLDKTEEATIDPEQPSSYFKDINNIKGYTIEIIEENNEEENEIFNTSNPEISSAPDNIEDKNMSTEENQKCDGNSEKQIVLNETDNLTSTPSTAETGDMIKKDNDNTSILSTQEPNKTSAENNETIKDSNSCVVTTPPTDVENSAGTVEEQVSTISLAEINENEQVTNTTESSENTESVKMEIDTVNTDQQNTGPKESSDKVEFSNTSEIANENEFQATIENVTEIDETNKEIRKDSVNSKSNADNVNKEPTECKLSTNTKEIKRKLSTEDEVAVKKIKYEEVKTCQKPKGVRRHLKSATFWPSNFRQKLCTCSECLSMYKDLAVLFLIDPEDTVTAYETLGKERTEGNPSSQYEKGLEALSSLDRIQQINALTEYNKMRDKLVDFLKSFKDRKEIVKEEDIKAFFAGMKPKREPDGVYFCR